MTSPADHQRRQACKFFNHPGKALIAGINPINVSTLQCMTISGDTRTHVIHLHIAALQTTRSFFLLNRRSAAGEGSRKRPDGKPLKLTISGSLLDEVDAKTNVVGESLIKGNAMKLILIAVAALTVSTRVMGDTNPAPTIAAPPTAEEMKLPRPPRARGISTALAVEAALPANASCLNSSYHTTASITDSAGVPIVVISNDGAAAITQRVAMTKAQAALKYGISSGAVASKATAEPSFAAELKANPLIDTARRGALPLKAGSTVVGAFAVSGAPGGDKDEACALVGIAKIQDRIS